MKKLLVITGCAALAACSNSLPETINNDQVYFGFDSAVISEDAATNLHTQSLWMKEYPETKIVLEGHCDERGSTDYNLALGALRAGNAAHVLIKDGIEAERIKTISYGKENPQYPGTGEKVWALNRNVTTKVSTESK